MKLHDIYTAYTDGKATEAQTAESFGFSVSSLRFRVAHWGDRMPLLLATLDKMGNDELTSEQGSSALSLSVRDINMLRKSYAVARNPKAYLIERATTKVKWELRTKFAVDFIAGGITVESAAADAGCSARQMRRWVSDLLVKHCKLPYADLKYITDHERRGLADEIDAKEHLDMNKQAMLKSISDGKSTLQDEGLSRVLSKRTIKHRSRPNV